MLTGLSSTGSNVFQSHVYPLENFDLLFSDVFNYHKYIIDKVNKAIHPLALEFESKMIRAESNFFHPYCLVEEIFFSRGKINEPSSLM